MGAVDRSDRKIAWLGSLEEALAAAKRDAKFVMLDFFNPG